MKRGHGQSGCGERLLWLRLAVLVIVATVVMSSVSAVSNACEWDTQGRSFSCPGDIVDSAAPTAEYTRCCSLEVAPYVDAFINTLNFGTPACCVQRTPGYTSAQNTPAAREAALQGPPLGTDDPAATPYVQLTGGVVTHQPEADSDSGLSSGAIAGIIVMAVGAVILIMILIYCIASGCGKKSGGKNVADAAKTGESKGKAAPVQTKEGKASPYARRKPRSNLVCFSATAV